MQITNLMNFQMNDKPNNHLLTPIFHLRWIYAAKKNIKNEIFILDDQNGRLKALSSVMWIEVETYNMNTLDAHHAMLVEHNKTQ